MPWIIFGLGVLVGTMVGVVIVALCQMASSDRYRRLLDREQGCEYDSLQPALLAKHAD
jgi:hypothetical protein